MHETDQQIIAGLVAIVGALIAYIAKLKTSAKTGISQDQIRQIAREEAARASINEDRVRNISREEISDELRWRSYGQRISDLERDKG